MYENIVGLFLDINGYFKRMRFEIKIFQKSRRQGIYNNILFHQIITLKFYTNIFTIAINFRLSESVLFYLKQFYKNCDFQSLQSA